MSVEKGARRPGIGLFEGFAGTINGRYFGNTPLWVDNRNRPGYTSMEDAKLVKTMWDLSQWKDNITPLRILWSAEFLWFIIAATMWNFAPYDFEDPAAKSFAPEFILKRMLLWFFVYNAYTAPIHIAIFWFKWSNRPVHPEQEGPSKGDLFHNIYYAALGTLCAGFQDATIIYLYANKYVPTPTTTEEILGSPLEIAKFFLIFPWIGVWREIHFFFVHIFIHIRFMYKHIHSIHHRNIIVEPFAGLTMHPVEHLFYFACVYAVVATGVHPFFALYCTIHATISPSAGHSGYEDIAASNVFHYLHHSKFECNYGTPRLPLDRLFGTYREKYGKSETYAGAWDDADSVEPAEEVTEPKKYLRGDLSIRRAGWKSSQQALFDILTCFGVPYLFYEAFVNRHELTDVDVFGFSIHASHLIAAGITVFPVICGFLLWGLYDARQSWRWPFHKDSLLKFSTLIILSGSCAALPLYYGIYCMLKTE